MRTYTLNFSTNSKTNPPVQNNGLNTQVSWNINWREIFGNNTGECRVRAVLQSIYIPLPPSNIFSAMGSSTSASPSSISILWTGGLSQDGNPVTMTFQVNGTPTTPASVGTGTATFNGLNSNTNYTIIVTATSIGGYKSRTFIVTTAVIPYKTPSVTSGLVLHSDFSNPSTYSGTGATFYNLVNSSAQSILTGGAGSYSYSAGNLIITNPIQGSAGTYLQSASYTFQTISLWLKINAIDTRYLYDSRNISGATNYIYYDVTGGMSQGNMSSIFINGGTSTLSANLPLGSLFNLTFVLNSAVTGNTMLGCYSGLSLASDWSVTRIVMYNRALTQAENTANYNALV